eukprot:5605914-Lingulodinium_polyedra.AAC.1
MGGARQGFRDAHIDIKSIVDNAMPGAEMSTSGAYLAVWNIRATGAAVAVGQGAWAVPSGRAVDLHWQAFDMSFCDASQLADTTPSQRAPKMVGLVVGNMRIPAPGNHAPTVTTKRRF